MFVHETVHATSEVFDFLEAFIAEKNFRGCALVNASVEILSPDSPGRETARRNKSENRRRLECLASAAGLDGKRLVARSQEQEVKDRLRANTDDAVERGAFGVPTGSRGLARRGRSRARDMAQTLRLDEIRLCS